MEFIESHAAAVAMGSLVLAVIAIAMCSAMMVRTRRFTRPFAQLVEAARQGDVHDTLQTQIQAAFRNESRIEEILAYTRHLRTQALNALQGIGFLRYDAFEDIRGQQSYSLCLLNARYDGLLITSIAGRTDSRGYAKPVRGGKCDKVLSDEEVRAIELAKESLSEVEEPVLAGV